MFHKFCVDAYFMGIKQAPNKYEYVLIDAV